MDEIQQWPGEGLIAFSQRVQQQMLGSSSAIAPTTVVLQHPGITGLPIAMSAVDFCNIIAVLQMYHQEAQWGGQRGWL